MIASMSSMRCRSYKMYPEGDNSHQVAMIVCELTCLSHISNRHNMYNLCNLAMFFTHNTQYSLLLLIYVQAQCDLVITRNTCVNVCTLNYLDLFLKYKIGQTCLVCVCMCFGSKCLTFFLVEKFSWKLKMLFGSLVEQHD